MASSTRHKMFHLSASLIFLGAISACGNRVVAEVGSYKITQKDADFRDKIIKIYYPQEKRELGLDQLIEAYRIAEILRQNGHAITEPVLDQEAARIDAQTRMPEILNRVKEIFGDDVEAYRRVYVLPTYAQRVIYFDFFLKNPQIQAKSLESARDFLARARKSPGSFHRLAEQLGRPVAGLVVSEKYGFEWKIPGEDSPPKPSAESPDSPAGKFQKDQRDREISESKQWVNEIAKKLKPGEVFSKVIDRNEFWQVVRFRGRGKNAGEFVFDSVTLPKANYGTWLESEKEKFRVTRR